MARPKRYETAAQKQQAYRERLKEKTMPHKIINEKNHNSSQIIKTTRITNNSRAPFANNGDENMIETRFPGLKIHLRKDDSGNYYTQEVYIPQSVTDAVNIETLWDRVDGYRKGLFVKWQRRVTL